MITVSFMWGFNTMDLPCGSHEGAFCEALEIQANLIMPTDKTKLTVIEYVVIFTFNTILTGAQHLVIWLQ